MLETTDAVERLVIGGYDVEVRRDEDYVVCVHVIRFGHRSDGFIFRVSPRGTPGNIPQAVTAWFAFEKECLRPLLEADSSTLGAFVPANQEIANFVQWILHQDSQITAKDAGVLNENGGIPAEKSQEMRDQDGMIGVTEAAAIISRGSDTGIMDEPRSVVVDERHFVLDCQTGIPGDIDPSDFERLREIHGWEPERTAPPMILVEHTAAYTAPVIVDDIGEDLACELNPGDVVYLPQITAVTGSMLKGDLHRYADTLRISQAIIHVRIR